MSNGKRIVAGLKEAVDNARGNSIGAKSRRVHVPDSIDVQSIRQKLGLTQQEFAMQFGFSLGTLRNWEQGTRVPPGPSRVLLTVIDREPDAVKKALEAA